MRQSINKLLVLYALGFYFILLPSNTAGRTMNTIQEDTVVSIKWPQAGQALLGNVEISGSTKVDGYLSTEISFGYTNDPTGTWFLIAQSDTPVDNGVLAIWDTTIISDGDYNIKVSVNLKDGAIFSTIIQGVRVRNYSPIETDTPIPALTTSTQEPGNTLIPTASTSPIPQTATPLPTNPVILTTTDYIVGFGRGVLIALGLFILLGVYLGIQSLKRNRS